MTSAAVTMRSHRSNMLDCIRTYAVMLVLIFHAAFTYPPDTLDAVALWFMKYGFLGVDIFFPLSGFLITGYLLKNNDGPAIKTFFSRRIFRILPLYFLAIATYVAAALVTGQETDTLHNIWHNILFLTGWTIFHQGRELVPYTITWSLSVEEFAYILIGLGAFMLRRWLPLGLLALTVFSLGLRIYLEYLELPRTYYYPPARLDSIAIGGLTAWAMLRQKKWLLPVLVGSLVISLVLANIYHLMWQSLLFSHLTFMTCIAIYLAQTFFSTLNGRVLNFVASIGFYSYFIYLFHYFNINILHMVLTKVDVVMPFWIFVLSVLAMTYVQAVLSFRYFEGPLMLYGRRLERQSAPIAQAA